MDDPARRPRRLIVAKSRERLRREERGSTRSERRARSGSEARATLASTVREDRAARARTHSQPKAVCLVPATVVWLEGALAHEGGSTMGTTTGLSPCFHRPTGATLQAADRAATGQEADRLTIRGAGKRVKRWSLGRVQREAESLQSVTNCCGQRLPSVPAGRYRLGIERAGYLAVGGVSQPAQGTTLCLWRHVCAGQVANALQQRARQPRS